MGGRKLGLLLIVLLWALLPADSKFVRKKTRGTSKPLKAARGSKKYGERLPWESRQETYDWEFREVSP